MIMVIIIGIAFTQITGDEDANNEENKERYTHKMNGVLAVFIACLSSGIIIFDLSLIIHIKLGLFRLCWSVL